MTLHTKVTGDGPDGQYLSVNPLYDGGGTSVPKHRLPERPMSPDMAYEIIHDELMLDGTPA
jgi:glutamate decarboxylase